MYSAPALGPILREHRLLAGLKQKDVAREIEVQQSQISNFENGVSRALSPSKVEAFSKLVGVDLSEQPQTVRDSGEQLAFCSGTECPTQEPVLWNGIVVFKPMFLVTEDRNCRYCSDPLVRGCTCGHPIEPGLNCGACGDSFIERVMISDLREPVQDWIQKRKELNALLLSAATFAGSFPAVAE